MCVFNNMYVNICDSPLISFCFDYFVTAKSNSQRCFRIFVNSTRDLCYLLLLFFFYNIYLDTRTHTRRCFANCAARPKLSLVSVLMASE